MLNVFQINVDTLSPRPAPFFASSPETSRVRSTVQCPLKNEAPSSAVLLLRLKMLSYCLITIFNSKSPTLPILIFADFFPLCLKLQGFCTGSSTEDRKDLSLSLLLLLKISSPVTLWAALAHQHQLCIGAPVTGHTSTFFSESYLYILE